MKLIKNLFVLCSLLIITVSYAQNGLVAHWSFDSISNDKFIDHVTNQIGGRVYGCQSVPGPVGNALDFDGLDDYVRIPGDSLAPPSVLAALSEGSISVWFRVDSIPTTYGIMPIFYYGNENACNFFDAANEGLIIEVGHSPIHYGSKRLYFTIWSNGCTLPSFCYDSWIPIIEGQWYHFVAVVGSNFNTGYLNGELMTYRHYNFGNANTHQFFSDALAHENLWIGRGHWDTNDMYFKGAIDEVKIFDHAVTQQEVDTLYLEGSLITSVSQNRDENPEIFIYPNPASETLLLDIPSSFDKQLTFMIYNSTGILVYKLAASDINETNIIDISNLQKGLYFYTLKENSVIIKTDLLIIQ
ncbi:MAG: LamG-like jellyroll fold domain-containing protein [Bacteroidota bacterium]|nr:LamG-like jellyroll fold domain-containing protein [Bacteroidota bacterium]